MALLDLSAWAQQIGATDEPPGSLPGFVVETIAGPLRIHPYDDWIACRFADVARARAHFGPGDARLNRHSGKWNWHAFKPADIAAMVQQFKQTVEALLPGRAGDTG